MTDEQWYAEAVKRADVAEELCRELTRLCPNPEHESEEGARQNAALRTALRTVIDLIRMNPPKDWTSDFLSGHWAGLIEVAMRICSDVELSLYDPRSHPERYGQ